MQPPPAPPPAPAVSVVMSVYNAERYVREAVESILTQTFTDFEFIIFDDGSTDRSTLILRELAARDPRIRLTVRPNKGLTKTLNEALVLARGELVARMDCDDVALPERLAAQVEFLRRHDDVVCAGGYWQLIDGAGRLLTTIRPPTDDAEMQQLLLKGHSPLCHPLATFRREAVMKLGGYDETFTTAQDVDLWLRLGEVGKLSNVPEVLLKFRLHESSVSETRRLEQRRLSKLACERAWQRRGTSGTFEADEPWRPGRDRPSRHRYAMLYGWWAFNSGQRRTAAIYALKAIRSLPLDRRGWVLLASAALRGNAPASTDSGATGDGGSGAAATPPAGAALSEPVVTVIMAMRNAERYVADSVRSVLAQEGVDLELVVVDDGSTDRSRAVVEQIAKEDPRLQIVDGPRAGIAMAVNAGLAAAKGEFVSRCDSDDLYPADRLRRQVQWLKSHEDFGAVSGSFETIDARGRFVMAMRTGEEPAEITDELRAGQTRTHFSTFLTRADVLRRLGGPRAYFEHAEDVDLQLRIGEACRVGYEPAVALRYRIHGASITHSQPDERRRFLDDMTREFQALRRRGLPDPLQAGTEPPQPPARSSASSPVSASVHVQRLLQGRAWQEHADGRRGRAVLTGLRALVLRPWNGGAWRTVAALALRPVRAGSLAKREKLVKESAAGSSGDGGQ